MATDGPTPAPCDAEVFKDGSCVLITHSIASNGMEAYVKCIAAVSGQRVDWHMAGGRARVLALGNLDAVTNAIGLLQPIHDYLQGLRSLKPSEV